MRIGLISDTHGLLRPEALDFLAGCDHIVHGGDIGNPGILERLAELAPLTVVRGNNDREAWARDLPAAALLHFGPVSLYAIHDLKELDVDPAVAGLRVVVSGHSHRPACSERAGVLYINPGSAGRRRFSLPVSCGELCSRVSKCGRASSRCCPRRAARCFFRANVERGSAQCQSVKLCE